MCVTRGYRSYIVKKIVAFPFVAKSLISITVITAARMGRKTDYIARETVKKSRTGQEKQR